jgi:hypothetical protein
MNLGIVGLAVWMDRRLRRALQATVRTTPSMSGGSQFGLLQYVGHVRPE